MRTKATKPKTNPTLTKSRLRPIRLNIQEKAGTYRIHAGRSTRFPFHALYGIDRTYPNRPFDAARAVGRCNRPLDQNQPAPGFCQAYWKALPKMTGVRSGANARVIPGAPIIGPIRGRGPLATIEPLP